MTTFFFLPGGGAVLARPLRTLLTGLWLALLPLLAWATGPALLPAAPAAALAGALASDGTLRPGHSGSFNAKGYALFTAPDGRPVFRPARTQGAGDEKWRDGFGVPGTNGTVNATAVAPNGDLYVGGSFTQVGAAAASRVAKWNGTAWSTLGTGVNNTVNALAVVGSDVYAGGAFTTAGGAAANYVAKWDGTAWSALGAGVGGTVNALAVVGSDLYVGGAFTTAGGAAANNIAKWNGTAWSALGAGGGGSVQALAVMGSDVYVGGSFTTAGGAAANYVAKWNGTAWSALGAGAGGIVRALAVAGSNVYAAGEFTTAGGAAASRVAKWNGTAWSALGTGLDNTALTLAVMGSDVYAGGNFTTAGGAATNYVAKWDGTAWSALGAGSSGTVQALAVVGSDLYAGGAFTTAGGLAVNYIARWNGTAWSTLGAGLNNTVFALAVMGSDVYVGGAFTAAGGVAANYVAKWDGTAWSALGAGVNERVVALAVVGSDVYAGGSFTTAGGAAANYVAKWNGTAWSALGAGVNSNVLALAVMGSDLYVGGTFYTAGGTAANRIAKWDGTAWSTFGTGLNSNVYALAVVGSDLYVGGTFTTADGAAANRIAKWDGTAWSTFGTGFNDAVRALAVVGSDLYAGGAFTTAGGAAVNYVAKWDGTSWSGLGVGLVGGPAYALTVQGSDLYAGGFFGVVGLPAARWVAKWDGTAWSALGTGLNNTVYALAMGPAYLNVGGIFRALGDGSKRTAFLGQYLVVPPPVLSSLSPPSGPVGTSVTLTGTGFTGATAVAFNGTAASFTVNSGTQLTATVPAGASTGPVTVTTPGGSSNGLAFTVTPPPTIASLSPGAELPGQPVVISGTGFTAASTVSFGTVAASSVTFTSSTSLTAVVPVGATPGSSAVAVSTAAGSSAGSPAFEVLQVYRAATASGCLSTAPLTLTGSGGAGSWRYLRLPAAQGGAVVAALEDTYNLGTVTAGINALGTATSTTVRMDGRASRRYLDRNFYLTATNPAFPGQTVRVRFFGLSSELSRLTAVDGNASAATLKASQYDGANVNCALADNDPAGQRRLLAAPATVVSGADWFTAEMSVADHFSEFYLTGASTPLPVELLTFTAEAKGSAVALAWRTASEKNSASFGIERSRDGRSFEPIGTVAAQGSKASPTTYAFLDDQLPSSPLHPLTTYYRLRQVDLGGSASYSPVRAVTVGGKALLTLYPNPARTSVVVARLGAGASVAIFDALGRPVARATADANGTTQFTLPSGLATGVYIVRSGNQVQRLTVE